MTTLTKLKDKLLELKNTKEPLVDPKYLVDGEFDINALYRDMHDKRYLMECLHIAIIIKEEKDLEMVSHALKSIGAPNL